MSAPSFDKNFGRLMLSAVRRLLQSGRCFVALVSCLAMRHGCRLHCAASAPYAQSRCGLHQSDWRIGSHAASSGQPPSDKPNRLFDEKRTALNSFAFGFHHG